MEKWLRIVKPPGTTGRDEVFTQDKLGCVNISMIRRAIANRTIDFVLAELEIDDDGRLASSKADINPERLARVTEEEVRANPLVMIRLEDGSFVVADGSHRLRWMVDHSWEACCAYLITKQECEPYRILFEETEDEGKTWREIDYGAAVKLWLGHFPQHTAGEFLR